MKALTDNMGVILRGRHTWRPVVQLVCKQLRYLEEKDAPETMWCCRYHLKVFKHKFTTLSGKGSKEWPYGWKMWFPLKSPPSKHLLLDRLLHRARAMLVIRCVSVISLDLNEILTKNASSVCPLSFLSWLFTKDMKGTFAWIRKGATSVIVLCATAAVDSLVLPN